MRSLIVPLTLLVATTTFAEVPKSLEVQSSAFMADDPIPADYTCDGAGSPPPLAWSSAPANTKSIALLVEDPDAPNGTFTHWLVTNIPATATSLQTTLPAGAMSGNNSKNQAGYTPPCPPSGQHHFYFTVFALDVPKVKAHSRAAFLNEIKGHVVAKGTLIGTYQRP